MSGPISTQPYPITTQPYLFITQATPTNNSYRLQLTPFASTPLSPSSSRERSSSSDSSPPLPSYIGDYLTFRDEKGGIYQLTCIATVSDGELTIEQKTARIFQELVNSEQLGLKSAISGLPKADLHVHLVPDIDGNLSYAVKKGMYFLPSEKIFVEEPVEGAIQAQHLDLPKNSAYLDCYRKAVTMPKPWNTGSSSHFFSTFKTIMSTGMPLKEQLKAELEKCVSDNVCYLELMVDFEKPSSIPMPSLENFSMENLESFYDQIYSWCQGYVDHWIKELEKISLEISKELGWKKPLGSLENPVMVTFLAEISRTPAIASDDASDALAMFFVDLVAGMLLSKATLQPEYLCKENRQLVVGVNIVGEEHHPVAKKHFDSHMEILKFLTIKLDASASVHAGELTKGIAESRDMKNRIRHTFEIGLAKRIGHGTCLEDSDKPSKLMKDMREQGIAVEICPSSNKQILGVQVRKNPFKNYLSGNVDIVIGTDDPRILKTTLTHEYLKAIKHFHLKYEQVKKLARTAIEASFLPGESIWDRPNGLYRKKAVYDENSLKAQMQLIFEKKLEAWEENLRSEWEDLLIESSGSSGESRTF